jgi:hypothetical protein
MSYQGAQSLAATLDDNATLTTLDLRYNNSGAQGARSLAAALDINAMLATLDLTLNIIGIEGARSLAAALDMNRMLQHLLLGGNNITADIDNLVADRLRVNKLVFKLPAWVACAVARRAELWKDTLVIPPALAARAAVLAFGDQLVDLKLQGLKLKRRAPGGRDLAAAYLLPRAEYCRAAQGAPAEQVQRLADAAKRARQGQSSSGSRAL